MGPEAAVPLDKWDYPAVVRLEAESIAHGNLTFLGCCNVTMTQLVCLVLLSISGTTVKKKKRPGNRSHRPLCYRRLPQEDSILFELTANSETLYIYPHPYTICHGYAKP